MTGYFGKVLGGAPPSLTEVMLGNIDAELFDDTVFGVGEASVGDVLVDLLIAAVGG
ncbi:MAG TPA: hypothetical protein VHC43_04320 [Mycobacteriales bacterium]|nr:hypothetical protein [Mycobacteriales bacterium]